MPLRSFHPAVRDWFVATFAAPTPAQAAAWPALRRGGHALIAAPTGSGKTLAAFLAALDELVVETTAGALPDQTRVLYVSPLKALSNDIHKNLEEPLAGITRSLERYGLPGAAVRTMVRTGDTPPAAREAMRRRPPHILVTTPESLYILLTSEGGRRMLGGVRSVIVDEIHALVGSKRGAHLALSLERLQALTGRPLQRIGLSATQKPIEEVARFLVGAAHLRPDGSADCTIVDTGHVRRRDLALELPPLPLEALMSTEGWGLIYDRLTQLIEGHRTTLVFVNTRRLAERVSRHLSERLGEAHVTAHHGSLSREHRLSAEQRLKGGQLKALVATASLELGIDIGDVDLVCQIGSPRSIAALLQRVGRSGHGVGGTPKGRLFPLSHDELVECSALLDAVRRGELDRLIMPAAPLDVLAQQVVAEVAAREWEQDALFDALRRAWPYHALPGEAFDAVVAMLADGFSTRRGRRGAWLHRDAVNRRLRGRRGARLAAMMSGGTIPDQGDFEVHLEPEGHFIGTVNEDFALESLAGDIFQLGNAAYRILGVAQGRIRVADAHGQPPSIPFWIGEAPARTEELSLAVSRLRATVQAQLEAGGRDAALAWLEGELGLHRAAAEQLADYLAAALAALGALPTLETIVFERFFDEAGDQHLVIHSPYGGRVNRAWGLALRKRFCRSFNFELQAAATEDSIVLSLGATHSFSLEEPARYLHPTSVRGVLVQALLDAPMFEVRWRWNATTALAVQRMRGGKRVPPQLQRMQAEDLVAVVFPDQLACLENIAGDREIPDHPLVHQTIADCLTEAMDIEGLERLLAGLHEGHIALLARDLTEPSPLSQSILTASPYAFLDDAPAEERRTLAVRTRRWSDPQAAGDLGRLDPEAIARVRDEAWPQVGSADELHDALMLLGGLTAREGASWQSWFAALVQAGRATRLSLSGGERWVAAERLPQWRALHPAATAAPALTLPPELERTWTPEDALRELVRGRLEGIGPTTPATLGHRFGVDPAAVDGALLALEGEGFAMRGRFSPNAREEEWCDRRLLARIHRYTVQRLRAEIEPVTPADFMRFLLHWQRVSPAERGEGPAALAAVIEQLDGFEAAATAWESQILSARVRDYEASMLDQLCLAGRVAWARLSPPSGGRGGGPVRGTPIALLPRRHLPLWRQLAGARTEGTPLSGTAERVLGFLEDRGASFFDELQAGTGLLPAQLEEALGALVAAGRVTADSFAGLRALLAPADRRRQLARARRRRAVVGGIEEAGRWAALPGARPAAAAAPRDPWRASGLGKEVIEEVAWSLLRRYGIVFRRLLEREADRLPPWRELLRVYFRLEARGEIRGGRFVSGFSGQQFALPEAVGTLREVRRRAADGAQVVDRCRRSAQSGRHHYARRAGAGAGHQPRAAARRRPAGRAERRRGELPRRGPRNRALGAAQAPAARQRHRPARAPRPAGLMHGGGAPLPLNRKGMPRAAATGPPGAAAGLRARRRPAAKLPGGAQRRSPRAA